MALFQKKVQEGGKTDLYTSGANKSVLIVGLGNPEPKYESTRHNIGFLCVDEFVSKTDEMSAWTARSDWNCHVSNGTINGLGVHAVKPTTGMNESGRAVQAVANFYKIQPENIVVVHDELDIVFGKIRMRSGGSAAGNNGVTSVSQHMGEAYGRIRVGIGPKEPPQIDSRYFVLQKFNEEQTAKLPQLAREVSSIIHEYLATNELPNDTRSFLA